MSLKVNPATDSSNTWVLVSMRHAVVDLALSSLTFITICRIRSSKKVRNSLHIIRHMLEGAP